VPTLCRQARLDAMIDTPAAPEILVVDDSPSNLAALGGVLEKAGYVVRVAQSSSAALAKIHDRPPALILLDVVMPDLDGFGLCRTLKSDPNFNAIPVIFISALTNADERIRGLAAGGVDFITKPFHAAEVLARVRTHLELHSLVTQLEHRNQELTATQRRLEAAVMELERRKVEDAARLHDAAQARRALLSILEDQRLTEEARRKSDERYRLLVDHLDDVVVALDPQGIIMVVNPAVHRFGYAQDELMGRPFQHLIHPEDITAFQASLTRTLAGDVVPVEFRVLDHQGIARPCRSVLRPVMEQGKVVGASGVVVDLTAQRLTEAQLRAAQKMEAIGRLAGGIAHDFNNALSVILSYAGFALASLREEDPLWGEIEEIRKAGEQAASVTRQLLAFSRKQVMQPQTLDLNEVASSMQRMLQRLLGEQIQCRFAMSPALWFARADRGQIEQVIMNLAVNARDAMPHGGSLTFETANAQLDETYQASHPAVFTGNYVMLAISDTGCGMDKATQAKLFEPFFTTKEAGKGTGLGLATAYGIVKQSGGYIWVYSEIGKGTTVKIYLPRSLETTSAVRPPVRPGRIRTGTESLLVVEDERAIRGLLQRVLKPLGYQLRIAANGTEALALAALAPVELLITDLVLPGINGGEVADRVLLQWPKAKVLFISGFTDDGIVRQGLVQAGSHFLAKPFTTEQLSEAIRSALDERPLPGDTQPHPPATPTVVVAAPAATLVHEAVPEPLRRAIEAAAHTARYTELLTLVAELQHHAPDLAAQLRAHAEAFDYGAVLEQLVGSPE